MATSLRSVKSSCWNSLEFMLRGRILRSGFAYKDLNFIHRKNYFGLQKHHNFLVHQFHTLAVSTYEKLIE